MKNEILGCKIYQRCTEVFKSIWQELNLKYQPQPQLLSSVNYSTQSWHICQNKVGDENLE